MAACAEVLDRAGQFVRQGQWWACFNERFPWLGFRFKGEVAIRSCHFDFDHVSDEARRQRVEHALQEVWRRQCYHCFLRTDRREGIEP